MILLRLRLVGIALLIGGCSTKQLTIPALKQIFSQPEFIASKELGSDGWPEARRQRVFKNYLATRGVTFSEAQTARDTTRVADKYRKVTIAVPGRAKTGTLQVSLALWPGKMHITASEFQSLQQRCDEGLFSVLERLDENMGRFERLEFTVSETCLDLTAQISAEQ